MIMSGRGWNYRKLKVTEPMFWIYDRIIMIMAHKGQNCLQPSVSYHTYTEATLHLVNILCATVQVDTGVFSDRETERERERERGSERQKRERERERERGNERQKRERERERERKYRVLAQWVWVGVLPVINNSKSCNGCVRCVSVCTCTHVYKCVPVCACITIISFHALRACDKFYAVLVLCLSCTVHHMVLPCLFSFLSTYEGCSPMPYFILFFVYLLLLRRCSLSFCWTLYFNEPVL